jgi:hypothetical protein
LNDTVALPVAIDTALKPLVAGIAQLTVVENEVIRVTFTNKGGQPHKVELKNINRFTQTRP